MDKPTMLEPISAGPDTEALVPYLPVPGLGVLPANAFLVRAAQPTLVDTGVAALGAAFMATLAERIDLDDLRWIFLTHVDPDHVGSLYALLEAAPNARVVTTFLGMGKLGLEEPVPMERVYLLNPGQHLDVGDRRLLAVKPPSFDAPETTGLFDEKTRTLFSSDCFGAVMTAPCESAAGMNDVELRDGLVTWTSVDAPWLRSVSPEAFERSCATLTRLAPDRVLSAHLPPAPNMLSTLLAHLGAARCADPFVGPDQAALLATMEAAAQASL